MDKLIGLENVIKRFVGIPWQSIGWHYKSRSLPETEVWLENWDSTFLGGQKIQKAKGSLIVLEKTTG